MRRPSASTVIAVARRTLPVSSGMLRQPSRPTFEPEAATITGLTSTSSPWFSGAFGCPLQSTTATRTSSPICGAAIPTQ